VVLGRLYGLPDAAAKAETISMRLHGQGKRTGGSTGSAGGNGVRSGWADSATAACGVGSATGTGSAAGAFSSGVARRWTTGGRPIH
jgi:hypothetical protein